MERMYPEVEPIGNYANTIFPTFKDSDYLE